MLLLPLPVIGQLLDYHLLVGRMAAIVITLVDALLEEVAFFCTPLGRGVDRGLETHLPDHLTATASGCRWKAVGAKTDKVRTAGHVAAAASVLYVGIWTERVIVVIVGLDECLGRGRSSPNLRHLAYHCVSFGFLVASAPSLRLLGHLPSLLYGRRPREVRSAPSPMQARHFFMELNDGIIVVVVERWVRAGWWQIGGR